jgi:hypothetical protein
MLNGRTPSGEPLTGASVVMKLFFFFLSFLPCTACAHVRAYERGNLARPTMTTSDIAPPSEAHVRAVQEGAVGGGGATGGGCGCN